MEQSRLSLFSPIKSAGFTLLELVLVLFLIGLLASAGLLFTDNIESQAQFDETQRRLEVIRKAIIQAGDRTVNGQPELSGFVVDNGRLPYCLKELTGPEILFTDSVSSVDHYQSPCDETNPALMIKKPDISEAGTRYGWWGPYIQVAADRDGERPFRDGYENDDLTVNYGWGWTLSESATAVNLSSYDPGEAVPSFPRPIELTVQSSGYDLQQPQDDFPQDIKDTLVSENDWLYEGSIIISFVNTSAVSAIEQDVSQDWQLTLAKSGVEESTYQPDEFDIEPGVSGIPANFGRYEKIVDFAEPIPVGYYLLDITCSVSSVCPEMASEPYTVTVLPRQQLAPLRWNLRPR